MSADGGSLSGSSASVASSIRTACLLASLLATLAACGGGGGGGGGSTAPPPTTTGGFVPGVFAPSSDYRNLCASPRSGSYPDMQGTATDENNWLRSWSNELYLWYDEIVDVDPARFGTPAYFDLMKSFDLTPSGAPKDRFHFTLPTDQWLALAGSGVAAGYGAQWVLVATAPPREVRAAFVDADTPASRAGLTRGSRIVAIDGQPVATTADVDLLNRALFPDAAGQAFDFTVQDPDGSNERTVTLLSALLTTDPVNSVVVIDTPTGPVGYVSFTDHIAPAEKQLFDTILVLASQPITDLILDVRYNGGGFLDIANELAYMIAGPSAAGGRVFYEMQFNDKYTTRNPVTGDFLSPDYFLDTAQGYSMPDGTPLPSLNLARVFVLTTADACSATETIINGLDGIGVDVIQVGTTTCGKPYGFYPYDNCGTTYFSIQFKGVNATGYGDYTEGFAPAGATGGSRELPGCEVADDFLHELGDPAEAQLAAALAYRESGACPVAPLAASSRVVVSKSPAGAAATLIAPPRPGLVRRR